MTSDSKSPHLFRVEKTGNLVTVFCPQDIDSKAAKEFATHVQDILKDHPKVVALNFNKVKLVDPAVYRSVILLQQKLEKDGGTLVTVNASAKISRLLEADGVSRTFCIKEDADEVRALLTSLQKKGQIDPNLVTPFVVAVLNMMKVKANLEVTAGKPHFKSGDANHPFEFAGMISFDNAEFRGSIAICFSEHVFLNLYSNIIGKKHEKITREIEDAAADFLDSIFGEAKSQMSGTTSYQIEKTAPTVLRRQDNRLTQFIRRINIILPFESEFGSFHVAFAAE